MYDAVGNRTASHLATGQMHDDANRLLEDSDFEFEYDANGNLISKQDKVTLEITTYDWDVEDRLIAVHTPTQTVTFKYGPLGRRIEKAGATTTRYIYDQEDIIEERDGNNMVTFRYVHGPGIDEPLARKNAATGQTMFFHTDGLGSVTDIADDLAQVTAAYRYDSYGNPLVGANSSGFAFTGREWDAATGLYYFRARYYDPNGRFLSEDPIGFASGVNFYSYTRNNPVRYIDPAGLTVTIRINRDIYTPNSVTSTIEASSDLVTDTFSGYALETTHAGSAGNKNPIPPGTYEAFVRTDHTPNRIELKKVPDFTYIQIHVGNAPSDVEGCFAVGKTRSVDFVGFSRAAMEAILDLIAKDASGNIQVIVTGSATAPPAP
jgi:RHS repeat-associated protein